EDHMLAFFSGASRVQDAKASPPRSPSSPAASEHGEEGEEGGAPPVPERSAEPEEQDSEGSSNEAFVSLPRAVPRRPPEEEDPWDMLGSLIDSARTEQLAR
ncbi:unnamed protein product, partial [Polarella glacialis]